MSRVYITGDCHGDFHRFSTKNFPEQAELTRDDYVIILGDFGGVWNYRGADGNEIWWLDWLENKPFTTLFVDGNHENFARLNTEFPEEEWNGGKVHVLRPHVLHLMRGYIFRLADKDFLAFGGAQSHDMWCRKEGKSWWKEEMPSTEEKARALENIGKNGGIVDYVLSHDCPQYVALTLGFYESNDLTKFFNELSMGLTIKKYWYFGHYHMECCPMHGFECLYESIRRII